jgi:hypothetical protein
MSLSPGTRLGPYEIVAPLGTGGMGEARQSPVPGHQSPVVAELDDFRLRLKTDDWRPTTASPCP